MNENEKMQAVEEKDLQSVAGGNSYTDKIKEGVQRSVMTQEEKEKIDSLLKSYTMDQLFNITDVLPTVAYGGPDYFRRKGEERRARELRRKQLEVFAQKFPNHPGLKPFLKYDK